MKYWITNLKNSFSNDPYVHMTDTELNKAGKKKKALPAFIHVHGDDGVSLRNINAAGSTIKINEAEVSIRGVTADKVIIKGDPVYHEDVAITHSSIKEINVSNAEVLTLFEIYELETVTLDEVSDIVSVETPDLAAINLTSSTELNTAHISKAPLLKSSDSVEIIRLEKENNDSLIILKQGDKYFSKDFNGNKSEIVASIDQKINHTNQAIKNIQKNKEELVNKVRFLKTNKIDTQKILANI